MKNYHKTISALVAASALVAGNASAEVEYGILAGYANQYLFRGADLGDDLVELNLSVSTEYNGLGLSAGAWHGSFSSSANQVNQVEELDLYGEVSKDLGFASASVGYISYQNSGVDVADDAQEAYFGLAQSYFGVDFSLKYFWDIETDNDGYTQLGAGKSFEISSCLTLNTGATLAYLAEESEFAHLTAKVSLDYAFTETATLSPFVAAAWGLTNDAGNTHTNGREEFVAGTTLSVSF